MWIYFINIYMCLIDKFSDQNNQKNKKNYSIN